MKRPFSWFPLFYKKVEGWCSPSDWHIDGHFTCGFFTSTLLVFPYHGLPIIVDLQRVRLFIRKVDITCYTMFVDYIVMHE